MEETEADVKVVLKLRRWLRPWNVWVVQGLLLGSLTAARPRAFFSDFLFQSVCCRIVFLLTETFCL